MRIAFHTLGCRANQAETAALQQSCAARGFTVVRGHGPADVVVINTCTVTARGDADARRLVSRVHREQPQAAIALIGCQAQLDGDTLARWPGVRWVVGTARKMELPAIVAAGAPGVFVEPIAAAAFTTPAPAPAPDRTRTNLKIQDGCNFHCAYCTVPAARGPARSRVFADLLAEAGALLAAGRRELVLTGINVGCYRFEDHTFLDVVRALLELPGLARLRISSLEPTTIPDGLLDLMRADRRLCRFLHIPLQSGSDAVLRAMRRRYTAAAFAAAVRAAHAAVPGVCLGTDVLVGFPGETDDDFDRTLALLTELPFAYFHVFGYSDRRHAPTAGSAVRRVPAAVVTRRSAALRGLSEAKRRAFLAGFVGTEQLVLAETRRNGRWSGLTDHYLRVTFPGAADLANTLVTVRLEQVHGQGATGSLVRRETPPAEGQP